MARACNTLKRFTVFDVHSANGMKRKVGKYIKQIIFVYFSHLLPKKMGSRVAKIQMLYFDVDEMLFNVNDSQKSLCYVENSLNKFL